MIRLILMRHGESISDLEPRRIEGMMDYPLSEQGRAQAALLGQRIAAQYKLDQLLCSPLQRARHTAQAVADTTGIPVTVDERLREKSFGLLAGLTFQEADERFPAINWRNPPIHQVFPEGESILDQFSRVAAFWFDLYYGKDNRTVGIVSHGGTINCLYRLALGLPIDSPHGFLNGDTAVHEWLVEPGGAVRVLLAGCTRHLRDRI